MDQLEEIKNKINIVDLVSEYLPLKKAGQNFKALCPFHSEKTPSFIVSPERQIWHCFGSCGEGGDIFKFLMKIENMEFGEALRTLAEKAGVTLQRYRPSEEEKQKGLWYEINHLAGEYYHYLLLNHPAGKKALEYILGRGISRPSLELYKLGFAPDGWDFLQKYLVGKKKYRIEDLEKVGLVIRRESQSRESNSYSNYYDRFRNRLMFLLKDHRGNVCGFAGRTLDSGQKTAKYINTPETPIYHKSDLLYGLAESREAIKKADKVILVEGEIDTISSFQAGVKNVVAIKGSALTLNQVQLLSRFTKNLVFALDQDIAGDQASRRGIEIADAAGMAIEVVEIKGGKDPAEVVQNNPQLWRDLVQKAIPVYDYFLDSAFSRINSQTAEGKRKIGQELVPVLARISSEIVRAHYIAELARRLVIPEEVVTAEVSKVGSENKSASSIEVVPAKEEKPRREVLEEYLLGLCFQSGDWQKMRQRQLVGLIKTPHFVRLLEVLARYLKRFKTRNSRRLAKMLPAELVDWFDRLYLLDLGGLAGDEQKLKQELGRSLFQLEELDIREKLKSISLQVENLEKQPQISEAEQKKLDSLSNEFRDLSLRLSELGREAI